MIKKILIGLGALVVLLALGVAFLGSNLDGIVRGAIEKYGTAATGAKTTLAKVEISLTEGKGSLEGFRLGNPEGFETESAIELGKAAFAIDAKSVMGSGPVTIKEVLIDAPRVTYEVNEKGESNLQEIQRNIASYASKLSGGAGSAETKPASGDAPAKAGRKIVIEKLVISGGEVKLSHALLQGKNIAEAKLPTLRMSNIGKGDGASGAAVAQAILNKLTAAAIEVGQAGMVKELRDQGVESLKGAIDQSGIGKAIDNLF